MTPHFLPSKVTQSLEATRIGILRLPIIDPMYPRNNLVLFPRWAPVKSSPPTNQHQVFLRAGCPSCRPTNSVKALKGKDHIPFITPSSPGGLPTLSLTTNSSWLPWGGCRASYQPSDASTPGLLTGGHKIIHINVTVIRFSGFWTPLRKIKDQSAYDVLIEPWTIWKFMW